MKSIISKETFIRLITKNVFTYDAAVAFFDYMEEVYEYDEECFDPIDLSIPWTEYKDLAEVAHDYGEEYGDLDYLYQTTMVIEFEKGLIVLNF